MSAVSQTEFDDVSTEQAVNDDAMPVSEQRASASSSDDMVAIADTSRRLADQGVISLNASSEEMV